MAFYGYLEISIPTLLQQVSPHTHRRVRDGVRAHQALRVPLESAPRVHGTACAHPLVHFCTAGRIFSVSVAIGAICAHVPGRTARRVRGLVQRSTALRVRSQ